MTERRAADGSTYVLVHGGAHGGWCYGGMVVTGVADRAAVRSLPRTNINCTETLATRPPERAARAFDADQVWEIDTGHDLMITEPDAVAEMLLRLAR
jgi:hypothetical protein